MTDSNNSLSGKTIIVTGAASGIGAACVTMLLARGANPNAMDNAGNSAMHYAVSNNNYPMVRALIEMGARYDLADSRGVTPVMIAEQGRNPLIMAAMGM